MARESDLAANLVNIINVIVIIIITTIIFVIIIILIMTRESHLAANPGAVVGEDAYTEYAKVRMSSYLYSYL